MSLEKTVVYSNIIKLRNTSIRRKILSFFNEKNNPVSAKDILSKVKANKTTIYREIDSLLDNGNLVQVNLGDSIKRFELTDKGHHHHLVCINCKSITEVNLSDNFTKEENLIKLNEKFKVTKHSLEFFGLCHNCQ